MSIEIGSRILLKLKFLKLIVTENSLLKLISIRFATNQSKSRRFVLQSKIVVINYFSH